MPGRDGCGGKGTGAAQGLLRDGTLDGGQQNAFRHAYWMAIMVAEYHIPTDAALLLGVAHEMDGTGENGWNGDESKIDLHNNFFGARIGETMLMGVAAGQVSRGELPVDLRMYMISFAGSSGPSDCPSCLYVGGAG